MARNDPHAVVFPFRGGVMIGVVTHGRSRVRIPAELGEPGRILLQKGRRCSRRPFAVLPMTGGELEAMEAVTAPAPAAEAEANADARAPAVAPSGAVSVRVGGRGASATAVPGVREARRITVAEPGAPPAVIREPDAYAGAPAPTAQPPRGGPRRALPPADSNAG